MAPGLLTLPNELLSEITRHIIPEFSPDGGYKSHKGWRSSPHQNDLCHLMLTCKHLYALMRPHLYTTVVLDYHTNMTHLLRTLVEHPEIRGWIRTLSIICPLYFCDRIVDPYSPRQTFLDDNPELVRKLDMEWNPDKMDDFAGKIFRKVGLDANEFKQFTEDEINALNDNTYWMAIPTCSERVGYENALMQGMALALIMLSVRLERLCLWWFRKKGRTSDFEYGVKRLAQDDELNKMAFVNLERLELWGNGDNDCLAKLLSFPAIKELVGKGNYIEADDMETWVAKI
ncbi:hypothetical protein TWF730_003255 [Orbilia blumenaviensis]|uniref:F-box domain-containing protein n=1 Tax=Orbilia blumenaviensis TaxID=1796055 RepID=A0AAV9U5K7_9PEZI